MVVDGIEVVRTRGSCAQGIMDKDASLLASLKEEPRHLFHFYEWERPSLTYGYFIDPEKYLRVKELEADGIEMARRPTGGGIIFHLWDMAFSLLVPKGSSLYHENPIENYKSVHALLLEAISSLWKGDGALLPESAEALTPSHQFFCMATPTKYDLMIKDKKLAGAAQRKTRHGYLHQGTISLVAPDYEKLKRWLLLGDQITEEMKKTSFIPYPEGRDLKTLKELLENRLIYQLQQQLNLKAL